MADLRAKTTGQIHQQRCFQSAFDSFKSQKVKPFKTLLYLCENKDTVKFVQILPVDKRNFLVVWGNHQIHEKALSLLI